jgi:hypothetical protein
MPDGTGAYFKARTPAPVAQVVEADDWGCMSDNPHEAARAFTTDFGQVEYALKRSGYLRKGKDVAEADWNAFARDLGGDFFKAVVEKQIATTLIGVPPRRLLADLQWSPENPAPLTNVHDLIIQGVCRVRNSYHHGEKFVGGPEGQFDRDKTLVEEAHAVLNEAIAWSHLMRD